MFKDPGKIRWIVAGFAPNLCHPIPKSRRELEKDEK